MNTRFSIILKLLLFSFILCSFISCYDDEDFSDDPNLQLAFSADVVAFDTIFANIESPMKVIKIYNRNDHSITIDSLYLAHNQTSKFMVNVNGRPGPAIGNIEVLKKDSVYIFVQSKTNDSLTDEYAQESDNLVMQWNGNNKTIPVTALQKQIQVVENLVVNSDAIITKDCYVIGGISVAEIGILNIKEGVTLYFQESAYLSVDGAIKMYGTLNDPITLRGAKMNFADDGILNDNHTDQWGGIKINATSANNVLEYVTVKNANKAIEILEGEALISRMKIYNSVIHNPLYFGIRAYQSNIGIYNSRISNSYGPLVHLLGGNVELIQNTIANYFSWYTRSATPSVVLVDQIDNKSYPFSNIVLANNLIVGRRKTEIKIDASNSSYVFTNNLMQVESIPSNQGSDNYWNIESPFVFENLNNNGDYSYSFQLTTKSNTEVFSHAAMSYSSPYPYDISGFARPSTSQADIGCYQHRW